MLWSGSVLIVGSLLAGIGGIELGSQAILGFPIDYTACESSVTRVLPEMARLVGEGILRREVYLLEGHA